MEQPSLPGMDAASTPSGQYIRWPTDWPTYEWPAWATHGHVPDCTRMRRCADGVRRPSYHTVRKDLIRRAERCYVDNWWRPLTEAEKAEEKRWKREMRKRGHFGWLPENPQHYNPPETP